MFNILERKGSIPIDMTCLKPYAAPYKLEPKSELEISCIQLMWQSKEAMHKMPEGKKGIVIGSGGNTAKWHERGWETLDINPNYKSKHIGDANRLSEIVKERNYDFLLSENISISTVSLPKPLLNAVGHRNLLLQAHRVLKKDGALIIQTIDSEKKIEDFRPGTNEYAQLMEAYGFTDISKTKNSMPPGIKGISVVWYARKIG